MMKIKLKAYAKINLGLEVLYKRDDGYHEINSILKKIDLHDDLFFEENDRIEFHCNTDLGISDSNNLVVIAAKFLIDRYNIYDKGVKITLIKRIPTGAGLGGGSSDAAYTLLGLNKLWKLHINQNELFEIAGKIGSDVPFFLGSNAALAQGRGEKLIFIKLNIPYYLLIVFPNILISTKEAYIALNRDEQKRNSTNLIEIIKNTNINNLNIYIKNDFEDYVFNAYPEIGLIKEKLILNGSVFALMSGSGSAVYGLFENKQQVIKASAAFPEYECYICDFV